ncbi:MAG: efflux RND transporter periplasmic adaptor subunit [Melioribacteraceae bacterium]|nr:efflux RND transporter periplasmic adaptor subunit [Melioribacteraceae bacterium]
MQKIIKLISLLSLIILSSCSDNGDGSYIGESGTIESENVIVGSKVSGTVLKELKDEGDKVVVGDTLMIIDSEIYELKAAQAIAAVSVANAQLNMLRTGARSEDKSAALEIYNQAKTNYELTEKNYNRMSTLLKSETITQKQFDEVEAGYAIAKSRLNSAKENLKKIKNIARIEELESAEANYKMALANLDLANKSLKDCFVTSPIKGRIVKKFIEAGENASPMTSLFKISDLTKIEMVVYVSEVDLGKVKYGQKVEVNVDSFPEETFDGKVIYISSESEFTPKSIQTKDERTKLVFAVKMEIDNKELKLKSGMPGDARIIL